MATCNLNYSDDYIIDIHMTLQSRPFERQMMKKNKVYPLPYSSSCQHYGCFEKTVLKRYYKAICKLCSCTTSTTDKNRNAICFTCKDKIKDKIKSKIKVICYSCNQTVLSFKKNKYGFICNDCDDSHLNSIYCPVCEYKVDENKICDFCLNGEIRKQFSEQEKKVLCCHCEQVAIQFNPLNENVYCEECKVLFLNNNIV